MQGRGLWLAIAALGLLAACGRTPSDPKSSLLNERDAIAAPVTNAASPVPSASASLPPAPIVPASAKTSAKLVATYPPRDECAKLPGFAAFREAVFAATAKRDADALAALADADIHLDFGGGAGRDEFRKRLADPNGGLWDEIAALAPLGCAADGTVATLPAIFSRVPADVDPARTMLVTGSDVPLRAKPSPRAALVRSLEWALVTLTGDGFDPKARYAGVVANDGSSGFVATAKLRSLLDYRLIADNNPDGEYRITALIAGD